MKASELKLIQTYLGTAGLYSGEIDGKRGAKTNKAIDAVLMQRTIYLPDAWVSWSGNRKAVAYLQLLCHDNNIDSGKIDGFYGPQTESASHRLRILNSTGTLPRGFGDIAIIRENPQSFPLESEERLNKYYGRPCETRMIKVHCPWTLRLDWDLTGTASTILIHEKLSESLFRILHNIYEAYGTEGIKRYGLDRYGGSYKCRKKRGSLSACSTHSWGVSIDWYPSRNKMNWNSEKASLAHPDLDTWWEIWEQEGWVSLGRIEDRDWMHVQAARR